MIVFSAQLAEGEVASPFPNLFHSIHPLLNMKAAKASVAPHLPIYLLYIMSPCIHFPEFVNLCLPTPGIYI
jgi:hypothetical protein